MRRVLIGDLLAAAAVIRSQPNPAAACQTLIGQADAAHRYAKRFGRPHPRWGNGSLMARALAAPVSGAVNLSDPDLLAALSWLCAALSARRRVGAPPDQPWLCPPAAPYVRLEPQTESKHGRDTHKTIRTRSGLEPRA